MEYERKRNEALARSKKSNFKRVVIYVIYYVIVGILMNTVLNIGPWSIKQSTVPIIIAILIVMGYFLLHVSVQNSNDKKLYSMEGVDEELKEKSPLEYEAILRKRKKEQLLQMYMELLENERRKIFISSRAIISTLISAALPLGLSEFFKIDSRDIGFVVLFFLPTIIEVVMLICTVIQEDSI